MDKEELLSQLVSKYHSEPTEEDQRKLAKIYALALLDEDEKTTNLMRALVPVLSANVIAFYYGLHAKEERDLPYPYKVSVEANIFYLKGLVSADSLEFYLSALSRFGQHTFDRHKQSLYQSASAFGAKRMMDHFGYDRLALLSYFRGLCGVNQLEVLAFLGEKVDPTTFEVNFKAVFLRTSALICSDHLAGVSFPYLLGRGLLTLSSKEWKDIEECNGRLFAKLTCDV